jgi:hypothetical protein
MTKDGMTMMHATRPFPAFTIPSRCHGQVLVQPAPGQNIRSLERVNFVNFDS